MEVGRSVCHIYEDVLTLLKFNAVGWLQGGFEKNHKTGKLCQRGGIIGRKTSTNFHHGITFILDVPPPPTIFILCCGKNRPNLNFSEKKFESFSATAAEGLLKTDCSRDAFMILLQFFYLILYSINQSMFISQQQPIGFSKRERLLTEPLLLHQKVTHWCTVTGDSMLITIQDRLNQSHRISFSLGDHPKDEI